MNEAVVARVTPQSGESWLAIDGATSGLGPRVCATADPDSLCFFPSSDNFGAVLLSASAGQPLFEFDEYVQTALGSAELGLLLLVSFTDMLAVGKHGLAWRSRELVLDDLAIVEITAEGIVCDGYPGYPSYGRAPRIIIDPSTGLEVGVTPRRSRWPNFGAKK